MADDDGVPAVVLAAWGLRERPHKGPKRALSLDQIVQAGIAVALSEGYDAISMARVAKELSASTMALYRYVGSKDELLELMVDAAIGEPPEPVAGHDWRAGLDHWAWAERAVFHRQLWALRVPITGPPATPNQLSWLEAGLACLAGTGLTESEKMSTMLLLSGYVRNEALLMAQIVAAQRALNKTLGEAMASYGAILRKVLHPKQFPALTAVMNAGIMDGPDGPDDEFVFGLQRLLDGVGLLIDSRRAA
jgi:AcrR family transcriptional regulator